MRADILSLVGSLHQLATCKHAHAERGKRLTTIAQLLDGQEQQQYFSVLLQECSKWSMMHLPAAAAGQSAAQPPSLSPAQSPQTVQHTAAAMLASSSNSGALGAPSNAPGPTDIVRHATTSGSQSTK